MRLNFLFVTLFAILVTIGLFYSIDKDSISQLTAELPAIEEEKYTGPEVAPLVLPDTTINFPYTDDLEGESIIIKTDKKTYHDASSDDVYTSITSTSGLEEVAVLAFYFSRHKNDGVTSIEQRKNGQWKSLEFYEENIQIDEEALDSALKKRESMPSDFKVKAATQIEIPQGETIYLRTKIAYAPGTSGEFWIEALGDKGSYGLLDPFYSSVTFRGGVNVRGGVTLNKSIGGGGGGPPTDTGFVTAGTGTNNANCSGGSTDWFTPGNITADDTNLAANAYDNPSGAKSDYLYASNFNFSSIPDGSTIDGIEVRVTRLDDHTASGDVFDSSIKLFNASGVAAGDDKSTAANWAEIETAVTFGGSGQLWGLTPSAADVKDADWGWGLCATVFGSEQFETTQALVDFMEMKIYYTP